MTNDYSVYTKEELVNLLKKLKSQKKYGLIWDEERAKEQFEKESENALPVLKEIKSQEINTNSSKPFNILIEGDNYHALSVLNYTHQKKIDFIYVDPPYNTGNKTWKYNNKYVDEEDTFKHSKWISFMYKRLALAKKLLSENGTICVTIDNYEIHNLRHMMEEIYGEKEIVTTVIEHNFRGRAKNNFALTHEYALWALPKDKDIITRLKEKADDIKRNLRRTGQGSRRKESPTLFYGIEVNVNTHKILSITQPIKFKEKLPKTKNKNSEYVFPIDNNGVERRWYYGPKTLKEEIKRENVFAKKIRGRLEIHYQKAGKYKRRKSVWSGKKYDGSTYGSELLTEIIGENDFPFPKSLYAVMECIESATNNKNAIILDFFAGSGTTGHAVLELNKNDDGNRSFILCTDNENNICSNICYPRIKKVVKGYNFKGKVKELLYERKITFSIIKNCDNLKEELEDTISDNKKKYDDIKIEIENSFIRINGIRNIDSKKKGLDGNLKYFKTAFLRKTISKDDLRVRITRESTEMLCLREGIFNEIKTTNDYRIFQYNDRTMGVYYSLERTKLKLLKQDLDKIKGKKILYCLTLDPFGLDKNDFWNWKGISIEPIPQKILDIYGSIYEY